jgi:anthranilate/para-aminobenzoate synthase component II
VFKNDEISLAGVAELLQSGRVHNVVISPGPGTPHCPQDIGERLPREPGYLAMHQSFWPLTPP